MTSLTQLRVTLGAAIPALAIPGASTLFGMDLNNKVDLGQLFIVLSGIVTVIVFIVTMKADLKNLATFIREQHEATGERIEKVETQLEKMADVMIKMARQEERMDAASKRQETMEGRIVALTDELSRLRTFGVNGAPNERLLGGPATKTY